MGDRHFDPMVFPDELVLERLRSYAQGRLRIEQLRDHLKVEAFRDLTDKLVVQLEAEILGDKIETKTLREIRDVAVPANWWQHLRERVLDDRGRLDRWILKRWPIGYRYVSVELVVDVERWVTFPKAEPSIYPPELGPIVVRQLAHPRYER